ncbi:CpaF family protein [Methylonatrum kenyense]|uniref:CpaF family protein n=1 Tax=Methylonatrum kenyense TaxID=455253 RepID=UPI0024A671FD|nr:CpaF family protein [Methylonatrum kenyense]
MASSSDVTSKFTLRADRVERDLRPDLHRHLIAAIEEDGIDISNWLRGNLTDYVADRCAAYVAERNVAMSRYDLDRLVEEVVDELVGYGPLQQLLADPRITEILVNGAKRIFIEREGRLRETDLEFVDDNHVLRVMQRILAPIGRRLDEEQPMVDARLPDGSRVNAIIPPLALDGPCVSIRKFSHDLMQAEDLLQNGTLDTALLSLLETSVRERCNILISGGTGTGKTTLLNMISSQIDDAERVVTIEDAAELRLKNHHVVRLETRPPNVEGRGMIKARDLVRNALRMRPDRILVGEVRSDEVLDLLQAMNTGHDGSMSSLHANTAQDALLRLEMLVGLAGHQTPEETLRRMIAMALDLVVHVTRLRSGRRLVSEVLEVLDVRDGYYVVNSLCRYDPDADRFVMSETPPSLDKLRHQPLFGGGRRW